MARVRLAAPCRLSGCDDAPHAPGGVLHRSGRPPPSPCSCSCRPPADPSRGRGTERAEPAAFPARHAVAAARRYVAHRAGSVSFALIDSRGRLYGTRRGGTYVSASVTKAMMLVAYLRQHRRAPARRGRARSAGADDHALGQRPGRHGVPAGSATPRFARWPPGRGMRSFSVSGLLGLRPHHGGGPGPVLPADRPPGAARAAAATRAGSSPRW